MKHEVVKEVFSDIIDRMYKNDIKDEDKYYRKADSLLTEFLGEYNGRIISFVENLHKKHFPDSEKYVKPPETIRKELDESLLNQFRQKGYSCELPTNIE